MGFKTGGLQKRISLSVLAGLSAILFSLGFASYFIIQKSIEDSLNKRLALSRLIRNNIDNIITDNINRLYDISLSGSVDLKDNNFEPEKDTLKSAYRYSLFTDGIFLIDQGGNIILNYPERVRDTALNILSIEPVSRMLSLGKPVVSGIYTLDTGKQLLYIIVPLKDRNGNTVGAAGGQIDPTNPTLIQKLGLTDIGKDMFIDIVDSNGFIISSSNTARILTRCNRDKFFSKVIAARQEQVATCHDCHISSARSVKRDMVLAFVPLETAPWGISIQEPEKNVFTPAARLKTTFAVLGVIFLAIAFLLIIGINRSIVAPLKALIRGADRIAKGELSRAVSLRGSDEIGVLGQSFELMRLRLAESMDRITKHTLELETRVQERTRQINESQKQAEVLLQKIISSQEDERKRIGRELHDDTVQELSAALMQIDLCKLHPEEVSLQKIELIRGIMVNALDGVISIIQNLRPTLLDDLGLVAAIKSLLDLHLNEKGITHFLNTAGVTDRRFPPEMEITLFRIVQEAVANTARHSKAENFFIWIRIDRNSVHVDIEDDGEGFNPEVLYVGASRDVIDKRGLGLLGMKERVTLLGGAIHLCSAPGQGTQIEIRIPLMEAEVAHA